MLPSNIKWYDVHVVDINAARNIRNCYTVSRDGGPPSTGPEALPGLLGEGKPPAARRGVVDCHAIADQLAATAREVLALDKSDLYWCTADPGWVTGLCYGIFAPWLLGCPIFVYEGEFAAEQ